MQDRQRIQTKMLSGAASEEPLVLPLEAIELDAFCRRHEQDTFWRGRYSVAAAPSWPRSSTPTGSATSPTTQARAGIPKSVVAVPMAYPAPTTCM
ncbi:hypothetical protein [Streptomyces albireticuli]|uniref:Uncharacterized protein n=1 Tax=Streptomyces albireticuli TaxID=1940 RepID=A0A2A2DGM5_9ACTN|nr:hypothetical protein [Streptomyces albireticuli]MCD9146158.1 hypothetical protein [Streptomyces albireticuli]MCD9166209.1 hypothetical protein [Streptomyces albireticuli]MCD9196529.1 hypothetical protein [Streptomyces albireticuli]PAU50402.1 hypothetical protein CK936_02780 [Streptomyces albireticuli]